MWRGAGDGSDDAAIKEVRVEQNGLSQGDAECWERSRCMLLDASIMFLSSSVDRQWWHIVWDSRSMRQGCSVSHLKDSRRTAAAVRVGASAATAAPSLLSVVATRRLAGSASRTV